jgi:threonine aldolase
MLSAAPRRAAHFQSRLSPRTFGGMTIDLRSDTVTRPTAAMRAAMADAEVGDDCLDGDPTARRLEARVAELLGKERALFFPTGTMANQCAIGVLASRGTEIIVDPESHIVRREMAASAAFHGVQIRPVASPGGILDAASLERAIPPRTRDSAGASLICIENTHNGAGGRVTDAAEARAIAAIARRHALPLHLDGARLWNAAEALGCELSVLAADADTVMVSFSKGLGAPVGAALAGSAAIIDEAVRHRRRLGGGMRQSGVIAAAALHGLEHHLARLGEDHVLARELASLVDGAGGARVVSPETNIVMLDLPDGRSAADVAAAAAACGVGISVWTPTRLRMVTHLDVDRVAIRRAADVVRQVLES